MPQPLLGGDVLLSTPVLFGILLHQAVNVLLLIAHLTKHIRLGSLNICLLVLVLSLILRLGSSNILSPTGSLLLDVGLSQLNVLHTPARLLAILLNRSLEILNLTGVLNSRLLSLSGNVLKGTAGRNLRRVHTLLIPTHIILNDLRSFYPHLAKGVATNAGKEQPSSSEPLVGLLDGLLPRPLLTAHKRLFLRTK